MTQNEACIVTAHTGAWIEQLDPIEFHKYIHHITGKRFTPEELASKQVFLLMRDKSEEDFRTLTVVEEKKLKTNVKGGKLNGA